MTRALDDSGKQTREEDIQREKDIQLVYQTQAALTMVAERLRRDRNARLPNDQAAYMAALEYEIAGRDPSMRRH